MWSKLEKSHWHQPFTEVQSCGTAHKTHSTCLLEQAAFCCSSHGYLVIDRVTNIRCPATFLYKTAVVQLALGRLLGSTLRDLPVSSWLGRPAPNVGRTDLRSNSPYLSSGDLTSSTAPSGL